MNLTGKQLAEQDVITNVGEDCIAQHGIDLELIKVERMFGMGLVPKKGKTRLVKYSEVIVESLIVGVETIDSVDLPIESAGWKLLPGTYAVTFKQGCKIPADQMLLIRQRSSLLRNGTFLHSSVFDAGFETNTIGTVIVVTHPIEIEYEARIAQIYAHESNIVENLYDGQFQKDLQRKS